MPTNASSSLYLVTQLVGSSGATGVPGIIAHIQASSAAFTSADINKMSDQLYGIANYMNTLQAELKNGQKRSS